MLAPRDVLTGFQVMPPTSGAAPDSHASSGASLGSVPGVVCVVRTGGLAHDMSLTHLIKELTLTTKVLKSHKIPLNVVSFQLLLHL
jgi:hypothetical protein